MSSADFSQYRDRYSGELQVQGTLPWDELIELHAADDSDTYLGELTFTIGDSSASFGFFAEGLKIALAIKSTEQHLKVSNAARKSLNTRQQGRIHENYVMGLGDLLVPTDKLDEFGQLAEPNSGRYAKMQDARYRAKNSIYIKRQTAEARTVLFLPMYVHKPNLRLV